MEAVLRDNEKHGEEIMEFDKIYLGDAYELIKQVPDNSVDLIITDPPYCGSYGGGGGVAQHNGEQKRFVQQIKDNDLYNGFDLSILNEFVRVMKRINIYLWCNKEQIYDYLTFFVKERKCNWEMIVWGKDNPPPFLNGHYLKDKEYCLYFWEKGVKVHLTFDTGRTIYLSKTNVSDKSDYDHPTIKPLEIIKNLILNSSGGGM